MEDYRSNFQNIGERSFIALRKKKSFHLSLLFKLEKVYKTNETKRKNDSLRVSGETSFYTLN